MRKNRMKQVCSAAVAFTLALPGTAVQVGATPSEEAGTTMTWDSLYGGLGVDTAKQGEGLYDAVSSATGIVSNRHYSHIPSVVAEQKNASGDAAVLVGVNRSNKEKTVQTKLGSAEWTTSRYGTDEFVICPDDSVEGYVWNDYLDNLYAVTISDGTTTAGAVPWVDYYGEKAQTPGYHYNKVQIALNTGTSIGANQADVHRFDAFYDENGSLKKGTYTVRLYAEGFADLTAQVEVDHFVTMNVPYTDFYAAYNTTDAAVWTVEDGVDAVSTATTSKYLSTEGLARGTWNNGSCIMGVTLPVEVDNQTYAKLAKDRKETEAYFYKDLDTRPQAYSRLSENGGAYQFSQLQASSVNTDYLSVGELTTDGGYGDYQVSLIGVTTAGTLKTKKVGRGTSTDIDQEYTIYGAILNNSDGTTYGMTALENLWYGTKVPNVEIAWSVKGGNGLKRAHGKGGEFYQFENGNGQTLTGVTLLTDLGMITIPAENGSLSLPSYYTGDLSGLVFSLISGEEELSISGIPEELKDVSVKVSSGRTVLASADATPAETTVALSEKLVDGTSYTIRIYSSNYPAITRTVTAQSPEEKSEEPTMTDPVRKASTVTLKDKSVTYSGKAVAIEKAVVKGSSGKVTYSYYTDKACKKSIKAAEVKNAGIYYVKARVEADADYEAAESSVAKLVIQKKKTSIQLKGKKNSYTGKKQSVGKAVVKGSSGKVTYSYYTDKACKRSIKAAAVKNAGTYYVKAGVEADANYTAAESSVAKLVIQKKKTTIRLKDKKVSYTGKKQSIGKAAVKGSSGKVTYRYYTDKACKKSIKAAKVKDAGTYYVKASVAADTNYKAAVSKVVKLVIK